MFQLCCHDRDVPAEHQAGLRYLRQDQEGHHHRRTRGSREVHAPSLPPNTIQLLLFFIFFFLPFWPQIEVSPSTLRFTVLQHNDPAAAQDHCGRWRIRTRDLCPKSLVRYQRATTSPTNEWET